MKRALLTLTVLAAASTIQAQNDSVLPAGVKAVWDVEKAWRETTSTREKVCLNGLWQWQPAKFDLIRTVEEEGKASDLKPEEKEALKEYGAALQIERDPKAAKEAVAKARKQQDDFRTKFTALHDRVMERATGPLPAEKWGYFKVPGAWPGKQDYMLKDNQTVFTNPAWKDVNIAGISRAWYQREVTVPKEWAGRRIKLTADHLNSVAMVLVDGKKAGKLWYPAGELDITSLCTPGKHVLSMLVIAQPLSVVTKNFGDSNAEKDSVGNVTLRGLCGDVFLIGAPNGAAVANIKVDTSFRKGEISVTAKLEGVDPAADYAFKIQITEKDKSVKEFTSQAFKGNALVDGKITITEKWKAEKLWDTHTPQNMYHLQASLQDSSGKVLDAFAPVRFGYRELWIEGRDFYLNGSRIFLSSVPLDNACTGIYGSTYEAAKESMLRLKTFGMNFLYTHNYGCEPGSHLSWSESLRAADDVGMLISLSQPHFGHYGWDEPNADQTNGYARHAEYFVRMAQNHPSVFCYSTSHNACGYHDDMNPDLIDGIYEEKNQWSQNAMKKALRAEALIRKADPALFVYHHSSGNLSSMHTSNFYPNFTPIQELSDWFEHWATKGVKPVFMCEYGGPFTWDFSMYRGWYNKNRTFGSARCPWELCVAEWCSQFWGDRAFQISELEKQCLRFERDQIKANKLDWWRWSYPKECHGTSALKERQPLFGMYYTDNLRAFRTWGVSATSPWEHHILFDLKEGINRNARVDLPVDWEKLQRPGYSPDFLHYRYERMDLAYERSDWTANAAGEAVVKNNQPLLAYIGGKPGAFTSKDHNFVPGESVEKQLIIINNSRETIEADCSWSLALPQAASGAKKASIKTGVVEFIPLKFDLPTGVKPGAYELTASVKFSSGETQKDAFTLHVLPPPAAPKVDAKIAVFDPKGETARWLAAAGVTAQNIKATDSLAAFDTVIIGKNALKVDGEAPDVSKVRDGLRVIIFEQEGAVLEQRFGFRIQEYGLRNVVKRTPDHPILAGLETDHLRDWRGDSTVVPPRRKLRPLDAFKGSGGETWAGIEVTRGWRCGNRGNVATALIEKPACGDFLPLIDGGFSLQYSPLLEFREGKGLILFCQMDVTGRTEADPAAETLGRNILQYVTAWKPAPRAKALYVGDAAGKAHLDKAGVAPAAYEGGALTADQVLIVGPGGSKNVAAHADKIAAWLKAGGKLLAIGLAESEANAFLPAKIKTTNAEHIAAFFEPPALNSGLAGVGPADIHNRDPRDLPLVTGGAAALGNGVLAKSEGVVFCQMAPWQFEYKIPQNIKRTFRRASCTVARLLGNMGVEMATPTASRIATPASTGDKRYLTGLYLDTPEEWDDPYRFFRW